MMRLMKNRLVKMQVRVLKESEFDELYTMDNVLYMDISFNEITDMLEYNDMYAMIRQLNNQSPYNLVDIIQIEETEMFMLIKEVL